MDEDHIPRLVRVIDQDDLKGLPIQSETDTKFFIWIFLRQDDNADGVACRVLGINPRNAPLVSRPVELH